MHFRWAAKVVTIEPELYTMTVGARVEKRLTTESRVHRIHTTEYQRKLEAIVAFRMRRAVRCGHSTELDQLDGWLQCSLSDK